MACPTSSSDTGVGGSRLSHDRESAGPLVSGRARIRVHVPFMYDLGGRVRDIGGLRDTLAVLCGPVDVDQAATRSWNLSYLAGHTPVLRCRLPGDIAKLGNSEWRYERILKVSLGSVYCQLIIHSNPYRPKQACQPSMMD